LCLGYIYRPGSIHACYGEITLQIVAEITVHSSPYKPAGVHSFQDNTSQ